MVVLKTWRLIQETSKEKLFYWSSTDSLTDSYYRDLLGSSTQARSIELCEFKVFRSEFQPMLMNLFRFSFLTTLDIYKAYLKVVIHGYRDQEFNFICEKLLRLYTIGFCNQVLLDLYHLWSEELCSQQQSFKLLQLTSHVIGSVQRS